MSPPGVLCICIGQEWWPREIMQMTNRDLLGKTIESITDVQWGWENPNLRVQHSSGK